MKISSIKAKVLLVSLSIYFFLLNPIHVFSQEKTKINTADYSNTNVEMADIFRSDGKIFVVVGVIAIVFLGIFIYLLLFERRVSALEKRIERLK